MKIFLTVFQNYFDRIYLIQPPSQENIDRELLDRETALTHERLTGDFEGWRVIRQHASSNNNNCGCLQKHAIEQELQENERSIPRHSYIVKAVTPVLLGDSSNSADGAD